LRKTGGERWLGLKKNHPVHETVQKKKRWESRGWTVGTVFAKMRANEGPPGKNLLGGLESGWSKLAKRTPISRKRRWERGDVSRRKSQFV